MTDFMARASFGSDYSDWLRRVLSGSWSVRFVMLLAIIIAAWVLSGVFWRLVLPADKALPAELVLDSKAVVGQIQARHWFGAATVGTAPVAVEAAADIRLRGVIAPNHKRSAGMAIFSVQGGADKMFAVGEEISPGVTLLKVQGTSVTVSRSGREEQIELPKRGRP